MTKEQIYELKHKRFQAVEASKAALAAKDMETYAAKMAEVDGFNAEINASEKLLAEEGRFEDDDVQHITLHDAQAAKKADESKDMHIDEVRGSNEYANAFAKALRLQVTVKKGYAVEGLAPLYKALTESGGTPVGADGGFLVPVAFDNMIHLLEKEYVDLSQFFNTETVTAPTGWRAVETSALRKTLPVVDEMGSIPKDDQPKFRKITYAVKKYGDRLPVSTEIMEDNTAGLMQYLAGWFGPKWVLTKNTLLLALLEGLSPVALTAGKEVRELKTALNRGLNTAHSRNAILLTNQSGYDEMDGWEDKNGRPMLVPNPADPEVYRFKGRRVAYGDNDFIPNGSNDVSAPLYIGNLKAFGTLFLRKAIEIAATDVGGDAWSTDSYELRAIGRMDAVQVDGDAAIKRTFTLPTT